MRKVLLLAALFLLLAVPAHAAEEKVGIVDMQKLISTCEPGQEAMNKLKSQFKGMKDDMDKQKADIDKLRADMEKQGLVMSQEAKMDKEQQYKRKVRDFQDAFQTLQQKMKVEEDKASKPVVELIVKTIEEFGKKNNYSIIMDMRGAGVMYHSPAANVTDAILVEVNKAGRAKK